jgi:hypothetical protein
MRARYAIGALLALQLCAVVSVAEAQKGRRSNVITEEEITKSQATTAFDAVRRLRPAWFQQRGIAGTSEATADEAMGLVVYVDGIRRGGRDELQEIDAGTIKEMRLLNATDATTKYGTGHTRGAIEVTTKH